MTDKAVLAAVERDGEMLVLEDRRRLKVKRRDDAVAASIWFPGARLTLRASKRRGANLSVTNDDTGETVLATA